MMGGTQPVLLDTNILVHLIRANAIGQRITDEHALLSSPFRPLISVVTVGEILALARKLAWGQARQNRLRDLIRHLVIVHLHQGQIADRYAEFDHYLKKLRKPANPIGQNDIWIAATAAETGASLISPTKTIAAKRYKNSKPRRDTLYVEYDQLGGKERFSSRELGERFKLFHKEMAVLRIVAAEQNVKLSGKARIKPSSRDHTLRGDSEE